MNIGKLALVLALGSIAFGAQARKDCSELKSEIDAKFQAKGVQGYSLDIVPAAEVGSGKVVGNCDGGASRIVYSRGASAGSATGAASGGGSEAAPAAAAPKPAAPVTPKKKTAAPPPIGNY